MLKSFKFFIIIFILVLVFLPGFAKLQELKQKLRETESRFREAQKQNYLLEEKIAQMKNNSDYLEIVAREKMGVVKKGETVIKLIREGEEANVTSNTIGKTL